MIVSYDIPRLLPYINWIYFFFAWGMKPRFAAAAGVHACKACRASWVGSFDESDREQAREALRLYDDAARQLDQWAAQGVEAKACFALFQAYSENDDIVLLLPDAAEGARQFRLPFLRQQQVQCEGMPFLCLSDFIAPQGYADPGRVANHIGAFATTMTTDPHAEAQPDASTSAPDIYANMLQQTLLDRLAEAASECLHEEVRRVHWGYAPDEDLTKADLMQERYQGIRPAVGYPSMPDTSFNFLLEQILPMAQIGISLTENGMMCPHASVSGLMFAHPAAHYFAVGKIGPDGLADYERRRGCTPGGLRKFLTANL